MKLTALLTLLLATCTFAQDAKREIKLSDLKKTQDGAYILFNGQDLTGWDGNPAFWSVVDGAIQGQTTKENPTKGNTFLIFRGGPIKDFELRAQWRLANGNSGIQFRSKEKPNWVINGYQADIADNQFLGILYEEGGKRGIMAQVGEKVTFTADGQKKVEKVGDPQQIKSGVDHKNWNEYVIIANGNTITQELNGKTTVTIVDEDEKTRALEGLLALQLHAGPPMTVQFKDITLKVLDEKK